MVMDLEKRRIYIKQKIYAGKSIEWIEGQLQKVSLEPDELELLRSEAAQHFIDYQYILIGKGKARNQIIIGSLLLLFGLIISSGPYLLTYGLILGGAWMIKEGYKKYNQPDNEFLPKRSNFRDKMFRR